MKNNKVNNYFKNGLNYSTYALFWYWSLFFLMSFYLVTLKHLVDVSTQSLIRNLMEGIWRQVEMILWFIYGICSMISKTYLPFIVLMVPLYVYIDKCWDNIINNYYRKTYLHWNLIVLIMFSIGACLLFINKFGFIYIIVS